MQYLGYCPRLFFLTGKAASLNYGIPGHRVRSSSKLKFNINDIGKGLVLSRSLDDKDVRRMLHHAGLEPLSTPTAASYDLEVTQTENAILVRGTISGSFAVSCSRCLSPSTMEVLEPQLVRTYFPAPQGDQPEELELSLEDLNTYTYDGESIDLEPMIREHLVLTVPMAPLCDPQCKGLCSGCGADRNTEPCTCTGEELKSNWVAALSQIKENNG